MVRLLSLLVFACFIAVGARAQGIVEDPDVTQLMERFVQHNRLHQKVRGWRVQVFVTTNRRQIESERQRFRELFPDYRVEFSHDDPFYHLKSGAFLTQSAARPFLYAIRTEFPGAFAVADDIDVSEVLLYR